MTARYTVRYATARLHRLWLFHGWFYPTTYETPPHARPYGAAKITRHP